MPVKWTPETDQIVSPLGNPLGTCLPSLASPTTCLSASQRRTVKLIVFYSSYSKSSRPLTSLQNVPRSPKSGASPSCIAVPHLDANSRASATSLERPTPRAISERIVRIRATAKASGSTGHFTISSAKSNTSTPRKNATNGGTKKATPKKTTGARGKASASKRKRRGGMSDE